MKQAVLTQFPYPWLPTMAFLIFFVFFIALVFRVVSRSQKAVYQEASHLPLEEGEHHV